MTLPKLQNADRFKYFIWRRHEDRNSWRGHRTEIVATDGASVRRIVSHSQHIAFQVFDDRDAARRIVSQIESGLERGVAMLGYSMFSAEPSVAILHTGEGLGPGWLAFPLGTGHFPTLPISTVEMPSLRVVGGASLDLSTGEPLLSAALEQRGNRFLTSPNAFNLVDHVDDWSLVAQCGVGPGAKEIRIATEEPRSKRPSPVRLQQLWRLDPILYKEFKDDPDFSFYIKVRFDKMLMCLPEEWLTHWFKVPVTPL